MMRSFCIIFGLLPTAMAGDASSLMQMDKLHTSNSKQTFGETSVRNVHRQIHQIIRSLPDIVKASDAIIQKMHGQDLIFDALHNATNSKPSGKNPFHELETRVETAMLENGAAHQVKNIARVAQSSSVVGFLGMDTFNFGLARAGSPWYYAFVKEKKIDQSRFHLIGGTATFVNLKIVDDETSADPRITSGNWRLCFSVGGALSVFLSRKQPSFKGTEFGGEDFYFGWQVSSRVPGWSYALSINNDYTVSEYSPFSVKHDEEQIEDDNKWYGPRAALSRTSGGLEFTSRNQFIGINLQYCVMGMSQGGDCVERSDQFAAHQIKRKGAKVFDIFSKFLKVPDESKFLIPKKASPEVIPKNSPPEEIMSETTDEELESEREHGPREIMSETTDEELESEREHGPREIMSETTDEDEAFSTAKDEEFSTAKDEPASFLEEVSAVKDDPVPAVKDDPTDEKGASKAAKVFQYVSDSLVGTTLEGGVGHCWCGEWKGNNDIASW